MSTFEETASASISIPPPSPEIIQRANQLKDEGNAYLQQNKFSLAAEKYTEAIALYPTAIFYSNRAQAQIKLEGYGMAIADADMALSLDPNYIKAHYRRASANMALGKFKLAKKDYKIIVKKEPQNVQAHKQLKACEAAIKSEAFLAAIGGDERDAIASVDIDAIVVDPKYNGPRLEEPAEITIEFVHELIGHLKGQKLLHRKYVLKLLRAAKDHFASLPSLLRIPLPHDAAGKKGHITVCGDTHGQYYDLLNIFEIGGFPSASNPYVFNGDFVDRGSFSFENVITLIAIKMACPTGLYMLRGNHETKNMNKMYGFDGEIRHKYDATVMSFFTDVFNNLPIAAVIEDAIFVVHGGLSTHEPWCMTLDEVQSIRRNCEPPESGLMSDLLWSDPQPMEGRMASKRGVGFSFGPDYTHRFLSKNGLQLLVRSHEVKQEGYVVEHYGKCITIFSAPNYCDQMGNKGAFIRFHEDLVPHFTQFDAVAHPNVPPMQYAGNIFGL